MNHIKCLIIDDEPLAQNVIENYLKEFSFIEVVAKCDNALTALDWMKKQKIDLIFLDISMPFISGIDFIKTLKNPPAIILTTAYREYAVESYELNVLDYLLKPIEYDRFLKAVYKAKEYVDYLTSQELQEGYIFVKSDYQMVKVNLKEILYIEGLDDYKIGRASCRERV